MGPAEEIDWGFEAVEEQLDRRVWERTLDRLRGSIDDESFATWIKPTQFSIRDDKTVVLGVPSLFFKNWLMANYKDQIVGALREEGPGELDLEFQVCGGDSIFPLTGTASVGGAAVGQPAVSMSFPAKQGGLPDRSDGTGGGRPEPAVFV